MPFDPDELRARYRAERDKRLRDDGNEQYVEPVGQFAHYLDDPYVEVEERDPVHDHVTVAFIGGGFSGLLTGARLKQAGIPYISVMTDPIYGGVSASLALLGDINVAEPEARAGFAGPNIIEQTIRQKLPKGFQRSEFLLEHGAIDMIVHRSDMRETIARLLAKLTGWERHEAHAEVEPADIADEETPLPPEDIEIKADPLDEFEPIVEVVDEEVPEEEEPRKRGDD